jgi:hypothetical protein
VRVLILFLAIVVLASMRARERTTVPRWFIFALCCLTATLLMTHRFA